MVINRNMAFGKGSWFKKKCCVCVGCTGEGEGVSLSRDRYSWRTGS